VGIITHWLWRQLRFQRDWLRLKYSLMLRAKHKCCNES
jgi:hypothetical protein